ncbi:MAG: 50S ribosomal protein L34e [Nanoarchaeota archaeon]
MKQQRSRSKRKVFVKTPGNKLKVQYKQKKPKKLRCSECGQELHGIPNLIKARFKNLPKTKKRPQRPYGGVLCSKCSRKKIIEKVRKND